jgi:hypothetical protein
VLVKQEKETLRCAGFRQVDAYEVLGLAMYTVVLLVL